jgi:hypothetical protein
MRAVEPSASPQLVAIDCAAFCGALAWPSRPIEYFGKTKRQIEKDIVRSRGARNARLGYKSQSAKGLGGTLQLIGLIGAFGWLIWFLGGMLTHLAKMAGLPIPALCQFIYYDWADSNTLFVAALFCLPFLTFIPLVGLGLKLSGAHARDVLANDPRPPILLLRSFGDEKQAPIDKTSFGKVTALESSLGLALAGL